jgi:DNA invertase Pin-like site-specific DNA recombinase
MTALTSAIDAAYVRISASDDRKGVTRQAESCAGLCEQLGGDPTLMRVYEDNDISAYSGKRREHFEELIADIESGLIKRLFVWHTDRLYRRADELERIVKIVEAHGVEIVTVQAGKIDLSTPSGRMVARMLGATASYEVEISKARVRAMKAQRAYDGKWKGGPRPRGFDVVKINGDVTLVQREDEAAVIRQAAADLLDGSASLRSIAKRFQIAFGNDKITSASVRVTLSSATIAGLVEHRGQIVARGDWQGIIDEDTRTQIVALLADRATGERGFARKFLGSGLFVCDICEQRVVSIGSHKGRRKYGCPSGCLSRNAEAVDELALRETRLRLADPGLIAAMLNQSGIDVQPLLDERKQLEAKSARLVSAFMADAISERAMIEGSKSAKARLAEIEIEISRAVRKSPSRKVLSAKNPLAAFDAADLDTKRAVVHDVIEVRLKRARPGRQAGSEVSYFDRNSVVIIDAPAEGVA